MARHYGMDWLRIGAFALLILYHIGMVFVPWNFHVKSAHVADWPTLPMLATNAWRLTLLFVVSGYASRALLRRSGGVGGFIANRSYRLLVPLAFGMAVIVPPQPWIELITKHHYTGSYPTFWFADYFRFAPLAGIPLPTWNHLWFVVYLWVYTAVLAIAMLVVRGAAIQRGFDRVFGGIGVVLLPLAWLVCVHSWWFPMAAETQRLIGDWMAHLTYLPAFLFGFGLAQSAPAMAAIARWWRLGAAIALVGYAFIVAVELVWPGEAIAPRDIYPFYGAAHALQQWGAIVALIGIAELYWNRDRAIRPMLTEAVFPFYLIHQTIIVVVMWALLPAGLPGWAEFAILVASTIAGCWGFYLIGRAIPPLRPLIGLRGVARGSV
jgi:glucan biosynthesis protein C